VPGADRDVDAAIRDAIDGRDLLGEQGWVAKSRVGDHRPEPDSLRDRGEPAERRPRIEELRFRCRRIHIVVEKPTGPSPGRLDESDVLDEVGPGDALPPKQVEAHGRDSRHLAAAVQQPVRVRPTVALKDAC
jgi:hypothetical protein